MYRFFLSKGINFGYLLYFFKDKISVLTEAYPTARKKNNIEKQIKTKLQVMRKRVRRPEEKGKRRRYGNLL